MIISHQHQVIFLANPKCASMTIAKVLKENFGAVMYGGHHGNEIPEQYRGYFTFSVIRNPYSRHVSLYRQIYRTHINRYHDPVGTQKMSFPEFVSFWEEATQGKDKPDEMTQLDFLWGKDHQRKGAVQFIRFERLEKAFNHLPFIKKKITLPTVNASQTYRWQDYYTDPAIRERVYRWFQEDFEQLDYPKEIA